MVRANRVGFKASFRFSAGLLIVAILGAWIVYEQAASLAADPPYPQRREVPPLPRDVDWINTAGPLELKDLRGKFVLLDFWTYCCINCIHVLPELKKLEQAYPDSLVVIGVHSAKFATEQDSRNIAEAVMRYEIEHPVVNDKDRRIWKRFGVRAWPTLLLIDPEGYAVWGKSGETTFETLDAVIRRGLPYYRNKGVLDETPLRFELEAYRAESTPLRFPGKVLADEAGERLFIADSNHHRIVVADFEGRLKFVIGSGEEGSADGTYDSAQFNQPQGMALSGETLYVADTKNHLIRTVDLRRRRVATVAGNGEQRRGRAFVSRSGNPHGMALASPWALWLEGDDLYIAMAGPHQIWRMSLDQGTIGAYAGNGREDIVDGPLLPRQPYQQGFAAFAQPSGLASDGTWLYVADSEGSSIRAVPLDPRQKVRTLVGTDELPSARLFTFGDVDGPADRVRLQHPLGVVYYNDRLFVADTYNNKIKWIDPETGRTETLAGTGEPGSGDDPAQFDEPAGLSAAAGTLYVADTNNHAIRTIDLKSDNRVSTLEIQGLQPREGTTAEKALAETGETEFEADRTYQLDPAEVRPADGRLAIAVDLTLPPGYKLNPLAPLSYRVDVAGNEGEAAAVVSEESLGRWRRVEPPELPLSLDVPLEKDTGALPMKVSLIFYYCQEGREGLCKAGSVTWEVAVRLSPNAGRSALKLDHRVDD